jgi:hypothetical protein
VNTVFDKLIEDNSYHTLLLAALNLTKKDFHTLLDAYIKDDMIYVYAKQPTRFNPEALIKHPQYLHHSIDRDEEDEYLLLSFSYPKPCKTFLSSLEDTELPLGDLWIQLMRLLNK